MVQWFRAAYLMTPLTPGISAEHWMILQKFRKATVRPGRKKLHGKAELDDTYVGGQEEEIMKIRTFCYAALVLVYADGLMLGGNDVSAKRMNTSVQRVIGQWRLQFPDAPYVCWRKKSPWENLNKLQAPPGKVQYCENISLDMGRNEYESTSFVLTNLSDGPLTFTMTHDPIGVSTTLRKAVWVKVDDGSRVNDALSLIDDGRVVILSGESLEIWITLHGNDVAVGNYSKRINILPQDLEPRAINISVTVHDISLPRTLPLDILYFDEIVAKWFAPEMIEAYMKDLKSHYVNAAYVHPDPLPRLAVDAKGRLVTDYAELDHALDGYRTLGPDKYVFFWAAVSFLEPTGDFGSDHPESKGRPKFMTPQWKALFRQWLTEWVAHMKDRGIEYDQFIMHPYDEKGGPNVQAVMKLIKEVDPKIQVAFNGALGRTVKELEDLAPNVDVWLPYLYHYLDAGGVNGCISQTLPLEPNTTYVYSFWGKNGGASIYYNMIFNGSTKNQAEMLDAFDWRRLTRTFTTASDTTQVRIGFYPTVGYKTSLIDDVVLTRSGSKESLIANGDMETGSLSDSWVTTSAAVVAHTEDPHSGRRCAEVKNLPSTARSASKKAAKRLLAKPKDKLFWTYANPIGIGPTKANPYDHYRLAVWRAWKEGMNGYSFWKYGGGRWDSTGKGANWGVVYRTDKTGCPTEVSKRELVVPSKRWEAAREGVEDYTYLYLLKRAISDHPRGADLKAASEGKKLLAFWAQEVLEKADNPLLADKAKRQIIKAILSLSPTR